MRFLFKRVIDERLSSDHPENRTRLGMLAGWVSVVLSVVLAGVKSWLGIVSGSVSMIADATNNLTDAGSSLVIALGFHWSRKPRDEEHPFGHGRIEAVATLVLSLALLLVGFEVAKSGVERLMDPRPISAPPWVLVAVGVSVLVKSWMAVFARQLARMTKSPVLEADAWNHTFDVVCTLMVVLALVGSRMGWGALDGWTAIGVALFILYTGVGCARDAIDILLGPRPDPGEVRSIHDAVLAVEGVLGVHEIMVHQYGDVKMVSFHIEVDAGISLVDAHAISEESEMVVEQAFSWRALAHIDPVDRAHPLFEELHQTLRSHVAADPELVDVHDLRAEGAMPPYRLSFDLVTCMEADRSAYQRIYSRTLERVSGVFCGRVDQVEIGIEASVESGPMERRNFDLTKPVNRAIEELRL